MAVPRVESERQEQSEMRLTRLIYIAAGLALLGASVEVSAQAGDVPGAIVALTGLALLWPGIHEKGAR